MFPHTSQFHLISCQRCGRSRCLQDHREDLTDIRDGKNWGDSGNKQLHKWPFAMIIKMLTHKARLKGIRVIKEFEESQTCCVCGTKCRSNRVHRGIYSCNQMRCRNRFASRETRPLASAHEPGKWQTSLPHPRTGSAAALSSSRA